MHSSNEEEMKFLQLHVDEFHEGCCSQKIFRKHWKNQEIELKINMIFHIMNFVDLQLKEKEQVIIG